jgi:acyl carrier protein
MANTASVPASPTFASRQASGKPAALFSRYFLGLPQRRSFSVALLLDKQRASPLCPLPSRGKTMDRAEVEEKIRRLIEPFNKKGVAIAESTTFAGDLEFDSLTVMDFVAAIEDEFDIIITMNQQAEIETFGQLVDAVAKMVA